MLWVPSLDLCSCIFQFVILLKNLIQTCLFCERFLNWSQNSRSTKTRFMSACLLFPLCSKALECKVIFKSSSSSRTNCRNYPEASWSESFVAIKCFRFQYQVEFRSQWGWMGGAIGQPFQEDISVILRSRFLSTIASKRPNPTKPPSILHAGYPIIDTEIFSHNEILTSINLGSNQWYLFPRRNTEDMC